MANARRRRSIHMALVLSLILSLSVVTIISKKNLTNNLWAELAAFAVPIPIALYFKNRIVLLGTFLYAAALILFLGIAIVFGI